MNQKSETNNPTPQGVACTDGLEHALWLTGLWLITGGLIGFAWGHIEHHGVTAWGRVLVGVSNNVNGISGFLAFIQWWRWLKTRCSNDRTDAQPTP